MPTSATRSSAGGQFANLDYLAIFLHASFGDYATFGGLAFGPATTFLGAAFGLGARYNGAIFKGWVAFTRAFEQQLRESWTLYGSGPDRFLEISFENARFDGKADFLGRSFQATADFPNTRFYSPPDFDGTTNVGRIDFTGAHIGFVQRLHLTTNGRIPVRLRVPEF
jgi:hypothetical protein